MGFSLPGLYFQVNYGIFTTRIILSGKLWDFHYPDLYFKNQMIFK